MAALALTGIRKAYGRTLVLHALDLQVPTGETVAVLGPNGAGKSTLLRIAAACLPPDTGSVHIAGIDARQAPHQARRHARLLAQDAPCFDELRVDEHLELVARCHGDARPGPDEVGAWGLDPLMAREVGALSRGQRQRLALLPVLQAPIAVLDEPFSALDRAGQEVLIERLLARRGRDTTLLALHDEDLAHELADRVLWLRGGRLHDRPDLPDRSGAVAA